MQREGDEVLRPTPEAFENTLQHALSRATWNRLSMHVRSRFRYWDSHLGSLYTFIDYELEPAAKRAFKDALPGHDGPAWIAGWTLTRNLLGTESLQAREREYSPTGWRWTRPVESVDTLWFSRSGT